MKICILTQNIFTLGGVQQVVMSTGHFLQTFCGDEITIIMPEALDTYLQLPEGFTPRIVSLRSVYKEKNNILFRTIRTCNRKTGCLDHDRWIPFVEKLYYDEVAIKRFADYLNSEGFDWVIGTAADYSLLIAKMSKYLKCKTAGWMHSTFQGYYDTKGVAHFGRKCENRKFLPLLDRVFVLNNADKCKFDAYYSLNTHVLHNPIRSVDTSNSNEKSFDLLYVGRLNRQVKGLDYLMEIIRKLKDKRPDCSVYIAGDGADKAYMENQIAEFGLQGNVVMLGYQSNLSKYYASARLLLSTSRWEGFGMSIVEAMSYGTPCVAFDNDGPREIISSGKNGILIPKYDIDRFCDAISELLDDESKYAGISQLAYHRAQEFSISNIALEFRDILSCSDDS